MGLTRRARWQRHKVDSCATRRVVLVTDSASVERAYGSFINWVLSRPTARKDLLGKVGLRELMYDYRAVMEPWGLEQLHRVS